MASRTVAEKKARSARARLKRQHGWARARIRGLAGARIWCGWGVLCHNATKIAALTI
jgi:IS5 family transposase